MSKKSSCVFLLLCALLQTTSITAGVVNVKAETEGWSYGGTLVKREQRRTLVSTEYGHISAVRVTDNINGSYLLHFFTLEPNALFLPVVLHADMVFYVHTGIGRLSWTEEDDLKSADLKSGDVYRLQQGSVFFLQNNLQETDQYERRKLRLYAIFTHEDVRAPVTLPYSSLRGMILGFDRKVLQAAFKVQEGVIDELMRGTEQPAITGRVVQESKRASSWEIETAFVRGLLGKNINYEIFESNKKKKKKEGSSKLYNLFKEDRDIKNCNGWSTTVTRKKLSALKDSNVGLFMVNLTVGSMMGPHWNPVASEISVVLQGRGMVRVVCSSISGEKESNNLRFEVEEGDVFVVPRFYPVAQMSFNNETLVFMGFSMGSNKKNYPQFLAGKDSVLNTLAKDVLAMSLGVTNTTMDQLLASQEDSSILGCVSCAEEELMRMMDEEGGGEREREEKERREPAAGEERQRQREQEAAAARAERQKQREQEEEAAREERLRQREQEGEGGREEQEEGRERGGEVREGEILLHGNGE